MRTYKFECILKDNCTFEATYGTHKISAHDLQTLKRKAILLITEVHDEEVFWVVFDLKPFAFKANINDM